MIYRNKILSRLVMKLVTHLKRKAMKVARMSEKERKAYLSITIWFNLVIGIYNLYVFNEMNSIFHLVLGIVNVGVWVFFRHKLEPIPQHIKDIRHKEKRP